MNNKLFSAKVPAGQQQKHVLWAWGLEGQLIWGICHFLYYKFKRYEPVSHVYVWNKKFEHVNISNDPAGWMANREKGRTEG